MKTEYVKLLKKQINKLDDEKFDLEAWKSSAIAVLSRVFGKDDARAEQIDNLKIDYSSWALRDSNSHYKPVETAKLKGKEIINTAIDEIEIFGAPDENSSNTQLDDLKKMSAADRKKHFQGMKKDELVDVLLKLTS